MTSTVYNERLKLVGFAINLLAVGMVAIGITTPLVSISYGLFPYAAVSLQQIAPSALVWLASAFVLHACALWLLGKLI